MISISRQRAVFFDLDDTLYDHLIPFRAALTNILSTPEDFPYDQAYHRMRYFSDALSAELGGTPTHGEELHQMRRQRFRLSLAEFGLSLTPEQAQAVQDEYLSLQYAIRLFDGVEELILELKARNFVVGVITNGPPDHQMNKVKALNLTRLIPEELIYVSGAVGFTKPDVRLFRHVTDQLGLAPEHCCYIGDSWRNDVVGALDAGWKVLWFNHRSVQPESDHQPHHQVAGYPDIAKVLLSDYL
ncbi:HAD family hydrolase [Paenibacillus woosongensis]|uniref:HAD-IA family hydrolase n=1 Tax=Paenibacillus woosongensis TaxID=307580 RepID=A0A7X2Z1L5_9BACL|nr:HAD family hydrolase [Paenibacillus woosongensis]MUG45916.1 HAD-IA family hydrolase [Paenibacillus woosongensis]